MFEKIMNLIKKILRINNKEDSSKDAAKERLHLVLIQDRASVSADFLGVMKQEIIDVIKKYIEIDEKAIDVRLTNASEDGKGGSPMLYANFPITNVKTKILNDDDNSDKVVAKNNESKEQYVEANNIDYNENSEEIKENEGIDVANNVEEKVNKANEIFKS